MQKMKAPNNLDPRAADRLATTLREMYAAPAPGSIFDLLKPVSPKGEAKKSQKNFAI